MRVLMFESWVLPSKTVTKFGSYLDLSSTLVGMLMSLSKLFLFSNEAHLQTVIGIVRSQLLLFYSHLDLPQVDLMNVLGREATVVWVAKRPSERRRRERSSFVRRVLNKQDEGLFRKSNSHQARRVRYYLSEINNGIYI